MPAISKIRFTNVVYESGAKRYTDSIFYLDGHNSALVLENGGGKTVFIQTALQAVIPHTDLAGRRVRESLALENGPAHIAIEWLLAEKPKRRYAVTCVSLFMDHNGLNSYRYVHEYGEGDEHGIQQLPFTQRQGKRERVSDRGEIHDYYLSMQQKFSLTSKLFDVIREYRAYLEEQFHIIATEWDAIVKINSNEGGIEDFFDDCKTTSQLVDRLLIPTIEQSMEGYEKGTFIELFQARRDSFKQYKELKEKIDTNRQVLLRLQTYVEGYQHYDQQQKQYLVLRQEASTAWKYLQRLHAQTSTELQRMDEQQAVLREREELWNKRADSLKIAQAEEAQAALETVYFEVQDEYEAQQECTDAEERQYYSIKYAEHREREQSTTGRLEYVNRQLEQLEQSVDEQELQAQWERNGRHLRAYYVQEEHRQSGIIREIEAQAKQIELQRADWARSERAENQERERLMLEESRLVTQQNGHKVRGQEIAKKILSNVQTQTVEQEMPRWQEEYSRLQAAIVASVQTFHEMELKKERLQGLQRDTRDQLSVVREELGSLQAQLRNYDREHEQMAQVLSTVHPAWGRLSSLHTQSDSIHNRLRRGIEQQEIEKQHLLYQERLTFRHVDDYAEQEIFFADPYVAEILYEWSNEFSMLQLGTQYVQQREHADAQPLWAVTLITTSHEKEKLHKRLSQSASKLQYPIRVLSTDDVKSIEMQEEQSSGAGRDTWIQPGLWGSVQGAQDFNQWKKQAKDRADQAARERRQKESELEHWRDVLRQVERFFVQYRIEHIHESQRSVEELSDRWHTWQNRLVDWDKDMKQLDQRKDELQQQNRLDEQQVQELERRMSQGQEWLGIMQKYEQGEQELISTRGQLTQKRKSVERLQQQGVELDNQHMEIEKQIVELQAQLRYLQADELYKAVKGYIPLEHSYAFQRLRAEHEDLKMRRHQLLATRTDLEGKRGQLLQEQERAVQDMSSLRKEHPHIALDIELPPHVEFRLEEIWQKYEQLKEDLAKLATERGRREQEYTEQKGVIRQLMNHYAQRYSNEQPVSFDEPLTQVQDRLKQEYQQWQTQFRELEKIIQAKAKQRRKFEQVLHEWNQVIKLYRLDETPLAERELTQEQQADWLYHAEQHSGRVIKELEHREKRLGQEKRKVEDHKQDFLRFCDRHVLDPKQREMAKNGIHNKSDTLEELLDFESLLRQSIVRTNQIAELHLQTEDQKLQQYITHIHMHLRQIAQELRDLPKKTRVRTASGVKEIYIFKVPDWEEAEGRQRIHAYIEWIVEQLDGSKYQSEQHDNSAGRVRKDLEKWLDSRQLLQKVLKHETIHISCRKVTNDQQVSSAKYSWETSNAWSGGERWSKNMTLFLGLLNYVAERKQHIQGQMKRHRVVILDNPFGKASSDHVLSPVFYIAEQLGFQIIALTAHAEGKFLQNYFPIMYSCRLRGAAGESGKQIIDPQQEMNQAYFRDHEPDSIAYLGEVKQLEFFD
ncbi:chromosome segregation ATPase [Paenibacillus sp. FSL L8-0638]|uniref:chromosome segregation ATPase n=1 Tax=Paenibacillus TaxID=44249 RepID=UPI003158E29E